MTIGQCAATAAAGSSLRSAVIGSGVVVMLHDAEAQAGGMLYFALPRAEVDEAHARRAPARFLDTGLVELLERIGVAGGRRDRLQAHLAGGADAPGSTLGRGNVEAAEAALAARKIPVASRTVGGFVTRLAQLAIATGAVTVRETRETPAPARVPPTTPPAAKPEAAR